MITDNTRLIDLTKDDLIAIIKEAIGQTPTVVIDHTQQTRQVDFGISGIARALNLSIRSANRVKASGKIDKAIAQSDRGHKIIVDVELARELYRGNNRISA